MNSEPMTPSDVVEQTVKETTYGEGVAREEGWLWGLVSYTLGFGVTLLYFFFATADSIAEWWEWPLHFVLSVIMAYMWPIYWSLLH